MNLQLIKKDTSLNTTLELYIDEKQEKLINDIK